LAKRLNCAGDSAALVSLEIVGVNGEAVLNVGADPDPKVLPPLVPKLPKGDDVAASASVFAFVDSLDMEREDSNAGDWDPVPNAEPDPKSKAELAPVTVVAAGTLPSSESASVSLFVSSLGLSLSGSLREKDVARGAPLNSDSLAVADWLAKPLKTLDAGAKLAATPNPDRGGLLANSPNPILLLLLEPNVLPNPPKLVASVLVVNAPVPVSDPAVEMAIGATGDVPPRAEAVPKAGLPKVGLPVPPPKGAGLEAKKGAGTPPAAGALDSKIERGAEVLDPKTGADVPLNENPVLAAGAAALEGGSSANDVSTSDGLENSAAAPSETTESDKIDAVDDDGSIK